MLLVVFIKAIFDGTVDINNGHDLVIGQLKCKTSFIQLLNLLCHPQRLEPRSHSSSLHRKLYVLETAQHRERVESSRFEQQRRKLPFQRRSSDKQLYLGTDQE